MTHLCVAIFVRDVAQAKRDIAAAAEACADMVELRLDHVTDPHMAQALVRDSVLPCIVTCRPTWEGGYSELSNEERVQLLLAASGGKTRYIDLELRTFRETTFTRPESSRFIISTHDFVTRPPRLYQMINELIEAGGSVNKIVWTSRSVRDNIEACEILSTKQKPTIALCMGEAGLISRVLAKKFGGFLTYASLEKDTGTAPGQISIHDMKRLYRWDAIDAYTKVY
ncbi:MAG TPA: type I 3-dehydroquinate dehydratase, partial [Tepidisphaeraceae bacterium]|nr:type I 3-dehydroquinate dehydratase [Tepidisphaeraceae bacterium]